MQAQRQIINIQEFGWHQGRCTISLEQLINNQERLQDYLNYDKKIQIYNLEFVPQYKRSSKHGYVIYKSLTILQNRVKNSLKILNLCRLQILSIQPLTKISLVELVDLKLNYNLLTSCQSIRKCHFPSLNQLNLVNNKIIQYNGIDQLNRKKFTWLIILSQNSSNALESIPYFLMKLPFEELSWLTYGRMSNYQPQNLITSSIFRKKLKNKYPQLMTVHPQRPRIY